MDEKTFIEIWYEDDEIRENWFATRSLYTFKDDMPEIPELRISSWNVNGTTLAIYSKQEIAALRMLLDEIEKELDE